MLDKALTMIGPKRLTLIFFWLFKLFVVLIATLPCVTCRPAMFVGVDKRLQLQLAVQEASSALNHIRKDLKRARSTVQQSQPGKLDERRWRSLMLLRMVADIGGYSPVAMLAAGSVFTSCRLSGADISTAYAVDVVRALIDKPSVRARVLSSRTAAPEHGLVRKAVRLVAEARLCCRLAAYTARGCSADAGLLVQWLGEEWPAHEQVAERTSVLAALATPSARRKAFMKRFRRFWHVDYGRLPCRADIPPELQKDRVQLVLKLFFFVSPGQICEQTKGPKCGHNLGPKYGYPQCHFHVKGSYFLDPKLALHLRTVVVSPA